MSTSHPADRSVASHRDADIPGLDLDDPLMRDLIGLALLLPRDALVACQDLMRVLATCGHEELAEVRQVLTAVRQLPGTPPGAKAVLRGGADLVRALDRGLHGGAQPER